MRLALVLTAIALAAAGAILLNLALLRGSGPDSGPVGKLSPRAALTPTTVPVAPPPPQVVTVERPHEADD